MTTFWQHRDGTYSVSPDPVCGGRKVDGGLIVEVRCSRGSPLLAAVPAGAVCLRPGYWRASLSDWWATTAQARGIARGRPYRTWRASAREA